MGRSTVTLRVTDVDGRTATAGTTISVVDPMVLAATNSDAVATVGQPFSRGLAVVGGQSPYGYALASGTLPPGLTLDARTGTIAGTPSQAGTFGNLSILVTDAEGRTAATAAFVIDVRSALAFAGIPSSVATLGVPYDSSAVVTGGALPYAYSLAAGTLPAGLALDATTGRITGTPTTIGTVSGLQLRAADQGGRVALSAPFAIDVRGAISVVGSPSGTGTVSTSYGPYQFAASGGRGPYTFAAVGGLPTGLTVTSAGLLSGVPSAAGSFPNISVRATDADGRTGTSAPFAIDVVGPVSITASLPTNGTVNTSYLGSVTASGGRPGYVYFVAAGSLPPGLNLDPISGTISGTPTNAGSYAGLQFQAIDSDGRTQITGAYQITVAAPLAIAYPSVPATRGSGYAIYPNASGGRSPYRFALSSGSLPAGLTLNPTSGVISGTPTTVQTSTIQVMLIDADSRWTISNPFTIDVAPALSLALATSYQVAVGSSSTVGGTAAGGTTPYTWSALGSVPGMTFNTQTGNFEGTPTTGGKYSVTIVVTDASGRKAQASTTVSANAPLVINPPAVLYVDYGRAYTGTFTASGGTPGTGTPGYTFALTSGVLPTGLTMTSSGMISGTATRYGDWFFTVTATDAARSTVQISVTLSVTDGLKLDDSRPQDPDIDDGYQTNGINYERYVGAFFGGQLSIKNAIGAVTATVSPPLPAGLSLRIEGNQLFVTGIPTATEAYTARNIIVKDSAGRTGGIQWGGVAVPMPQVGWHQNGYVSDPNRYAFLKLKNPVGRSWTMSKDAEVVAYTSPGATFGDGIVNIQVDRGTWVEPENHGFVKTQRLRAPVDAPAYGTKVVLSRDGTYMAVSAPGLPRVNNGDYPDGSIYVYRRNGNTWEQFSQVVAKTYPGQKTLAMSDDGTRIAFSYQEPYHYTPTSTNWNLRDRVSIRAWNGSQYVEEYSVTCADLKSSNTQCGFGQSDLRFSPDGSTLGVVGALNAAIYKRTGAVWQQQFATAAHNAINVVFNTDGTKMLMSASMSASVGYGWSVYAYAWDGRFWNEVGLNYGRVSDKGYGGVWDPYISASDDLSTFARITPRERTPFLYTWDGRGNPSEGTPLPDLVGEMIVMSGDGNTIYYGNVVAKRSWPSSR